MRVRLMPTRNRVLGTMPTPVMHQHASRAAVDRAEDGHQTAQDLTHCYTAASESSNDSRPHTANGQRNSDMLHMTKRSIFLEFDQVEVEYAVVFTLRVSYVPHPPHVILTRENWVIIASYNITV